MAIHLPFLGSLRAAQSVSHASTGNAIPLRQFSRRPQQTAGGSVISNRLPVSPQRLLSLMLAFIQQAREMQMLLPDKIVRSYPPHYSSRISITSSR